MKFLHTINVTHRDLKPQNILVDDKKVNTPERFNPVIIDFGFTNVPINKGGTPHYTPPEAHEP